MWGARASPQRCAQPPVWVWRWDDDEELCSARVLAVGLRPVVAVLRLIPRARRQFFPRSVALDKPQSLRLDARLFPVQHILLLWDCYYNPTMCYPCARSMCYISPVYTHPSPLPSRERGFEARDETATSLGLAEADPSTGSGQAPGPGPSLSSGRHYGRLCHSRGYFAARGIGVVECPAYP